MCLCLAPSRGGWSHRGGLEGVLGGAPGPLKRSQRLSLCSLGVLLGSGVFGWVLFGLQVRRRADTVMDVGSARFTGVSLWFMGLLGLLRVDSVRCSLRGRSTVDPRTPVPVVTPWAPEGSVGLAGRSPSRPPWSPAVDGSVGHTALPLDVVCSSGSAGQAGSILLVWCERPPPGGGGALWFGLELTPGCGLGWSSIGLRRSGVPVRLFVWFEIGLSLCVQGRIPPCSW